MKLSAQYPDHVIAVVAIPVALGRQVVEIAHNLDDEGQLVRLLKSTMDSLIAGRS